MIVTLGMNHIFSIIFILVLLLNNLEKKYLYVMHLCFRSRSRFWKLIELHANGGSSSCFFVWGGRAFDLLAPSRLGLTSFLVLLQMFGSCFVSIHSTFNYAVKMSNKRTKNVEHFEENKVSGFFLSPTFVGLPSKDDQNLQFWTIRSQLKTKMNNIVHLSSLFSKWPRFFVRFFLLC
jgi:hypothetical protein